MQIEPGLLRYLKEGNEIKHLPVGEAILNIDNYIRFIPIVLHGHVKVVSEDEEGNELLLYYIKPGESCIMSILGALNRTQSKIKAITVEETELLIIKPEKAASLVREHPGWAEFIFQLYQTRFEELLTVVSNSNFKKADDRILELLEHKSDLFKTKTLHITHQEIANEIGIWREAVSRTLKKMEHEGILTLGRGKITLL